MRPAWSSFLALAAAAAAFDAHIAAAGTTDVHARAVVFSSEDFLPRASVLEDVADSGAEILLPLRQWIGESYERAPALLLGLSVVMVVPTLALAGLIAVASAAAGIARIALARHHAGADARRQADGLDARCRGENGNSRGRRKPGRHRGHPGGRYVIGRTLVRIGREADNDIRLAAKTVHPYHAVIGARRMAT